MKKSLFLISSLTLGLLVASCQSGLEEVIDESAVQDELATTRAGNNNVIPLVRDVDEIIEELTVSESAYPISGPHIICGEEEVNFTIESMPPNTNIEWSYNQNLFYEST